MAESERTGWPQKNHRLVPMHGEWFDSVLDSWPAPISHEIARLQELSIRLKEEPDLGPAAVLQLRDVVKTLIKLPAIVMLRDIAEHAPGHEVVEMSGDVHAARDGISARSEQVRQRILAVLTAFVVIFSVSQHTGGTLREFLGLTGDSTWLIAITLGATCAFLLVGFWMIRDTLSVKARRVSGR